MVKHQPSLKCAGTAFCVLSPVLAFGSPRFTVLPGAEVHNGSFGYVMGISSDGRHVTGSTYIDGLLVPTLWSDGARQPLPQFPGGRGEATAVSADGNIVVGNAFSDFGNRPVYWTRQADGTFQAQFLWGSATARGLIYALSDDGKTGVGVSFTPGHRGRASKWDLRFGPSYAEPLGLLRPDGIDWSEAHDVSADGSVIVGEGRNYLPGAEAVVFTGEVIGLGDLPPSVNRSEAHGVSGDGRVIVGRAAYQTFAPFGELPVKWVNYAVQALPLPSGYVFGEAWDASFDGSVIVGYCADPSGAQAAVVWIGNDVRFVSDILEGEFGVDLSGWTEMGFNTISADGTWLAGQGRNPDGIVQPLVVQIPSPGSSAAVSALLLLLARRRTRAAVRIPD